MPKGSSGHSTAAHKIVAAESIIARNDFETAALFDDNGDKLLEKAGMKNEVNFTPQEAAMFKDKILTHNHPFNAEMESFGFANTSAFSSDDLSLAYRRGLKEIRMVIGRETHQFSWKNPDAKDVNRFIKELQRMEKASNATIARTKKSAESAITKFTKSQTSENAIKAKTAITKYYSTIQKEANKVNDYLSSNQGVGYVYKSKKI